MPIYKAPLENMKFVLHDVLNAGQLASLPGYEQATPDMMDQILEGGAQICEEVLFPLNRSGDEEGCTFENGTVRTPKGFKEAYKTYIEGGWTALSSAP
ncbi:MAG: acyl-CoA dehydrogenase N-terminal domain-containing protein, partial [Pseudomonadota bacterium]